MKFAIVFVALFAFALAGPADVTIIRNDLDNIGVEGYKFAVETSDGKKHEEVGTVKNAGSDNEAISVTGQFTYVGDDGVTYTVNYVADENGFQPQGAHIPVA